MTPSPPAYALPARALDRPLLFKSVALSLLLHLLLVVMFREAIGIGDDLGTTPGVGALTVRLKLRWTRADVAASAPGIDRPLRSSPKRAPFSTTVGAYTEAPQGDPGPESASRFEAAPLPSIAPPETVARVPETAALAELASPPRVAAEALAPIEVPVARRLDTDAPVFAEPPPWPRIAAEAIARIEAPAMRRLDRDTPPLPEPPPLPRVTAEPLARVEAPTMRRLDRDTPPLPEPPPLARVTAEPLAKVEAPTMRRLDRDTPPLPEPPPLPRVTAEPLARVEAPAMRALDPSTGALPLPPTANARAPSGGPAAATATLAVPPSSAEGSLPPPSTAAVAGRSGPDSPDRLDFGPRRTVDPDLAALVGEPVPAPPASPAEGRIDLEATRALARELNRAPLRPRTGQPVDLASPKPDGESTLGRAIARSAQPDCRAAYAGLGLLGLPFLLFDNLTDTGCRW